MISNTHKKKLLKIKFEISIRGQQKRQKYRISIVTTVRVCSLSTIYGSINLIFIFFYISNEYF